jgi:sugar lactone lactonase YvrE
MRPSSAYLCLVRYLLLLFSLGLTGSLLAQTHLDFRAIAEAAYQRKDWPAAREALEYALELQPDSPRYLRALAAVLARAGEPRLALEPLRRLVALGVTASLEKEPDFASLQGSPEFIKILRSLADNAQPRGAAEVFAELPGRTGLIEGIAARDRTGDLFLGDVHHRVIWRRTHVGQVQRFTLEDEGLFGVFGLAVDEKRDVLWAATAAMPGMHGYTPDLKGQSALAEFDLSTGKLLRIIPVPGDGRDHALGDLTVAEDGTVYATDNAAPVVWQFAPEAEEIEKIADSPEFHSLQGIVAFQRKLFVADYAHGLFSIDLATREILPLAPPPEATLIGLDGLVLVPGGLVATQNGIEPQRLVRIVLSPGLDRVTELTVLASGLPQMRDLALVTLVNERPTFIAGSGWEGYDPARRPDPPAHTVRIFQAGLP